MHVERVAVRDLDARLHQRLIGALAECAAAQLLHGLGAESRQALDPNPRVGRDSVERLRGLATLRRPAGHHERDRQLVEPVQDVQDELERGDVAPVQVVDREQRRARLGRARHHREQAVGHRQIAGVAGLEQRLACPRERAHAFGRLGEEGTAPGRRQLAQQRADELAGDSEGEVLLELCARRPQYPHAAAARVVERRLVEPGLAHPGVPLEQQRLAGAVLHRIEGSGDRLEQIVALQEPRASAQGPSTSVGRLPHRHLERCTPIGLAPNPGVPAWCGMRTKRRYF